MKKFITNLILTALVILWLGGLVYSINRIPTKQDQPQSFFEPPFDTVTVAPGVERFIDTDLGIVCYSGAFWGDCERLDD